MPATNPLRARGAPATRSLRAHYAPTLRSSRARCVLVAWSLRAHCAPTADPLRAPPRIFQCDIACATLGSAVALGNKKNSASRVFGEENSFIGRRQKRRGGNHEMHLLSHSHISVDRAGVGGPTRGRRQG